MHSGLPGAVRNEAEAEAVCSIEDSESTLRCRSDRPEETGIVLPSKEVRVPSPPVGKEFPPHLYVNSDLCFSNLLCLEMLCPFLSPAFALLVFST